MTNLTDNGAESVWRPHEHVAGEQSSVGTTHAAQRPALYTHTHTHKSQVVSVHQQSGIQSPEITTNQQRDNDSDDELTVTLTMFFVYRAHARLTEVIRDCFKVFIRFVAFRFECCLVPARAEFTASADVGQSKHSASFQPPGTELAGVERQLRDLKATVAVPTQGTGDKRDRETETEKNHEEE